MMRSATAFLPDSITTFMNFERSTDPNLGSGRISRLGTSRRRGMVFPSVLQLASDARRPSARAATLSNGATHLLGECSNSFDRIHRNFAPKPTSRDQLRDILIAD